MSAQLAFALPCAAPSDCVVINARCSVRIEADQRVIVVRNGVEIGRAIAGWGGDNVRLLDVVIK